MNKKVRFNKLSTSDTFRDFRDRLLECRMLVFRVQASFLTVCGEMNRLRLNFRLTCPNHQAAFLKNPNSFPQMSQIATSND